MSLESFDRLWCKHLSGEKLDKHEAQLLVEQLDNDRDLRRDIADERIVDAMLQTKLGDKAFIAGCVEAIQQASSGPLESNSPVAKSDAAQPHGFSSFSLIGLAAAVLAMGVLAFLYWPGESKRTTEIERRSGVNVPAADDSNESKSLPETNNLTDPIDSIASNKPTTADGLPNPNDSVVLQESQNQESHNQETRENQKLAAEASPNTSLVDQSKPPTKQSNQGVVVDPSSPKPSDSVAKNEPMVDSLNEQTPTENGVEGEPEYMLANLLNLGDLNTYDGELPERVGRSELAFATGKGSISFDNGAEIRFIAPATIEINSAKKVTLNEGQFQILLPKTFPTFEVVASDRAWVSEGRVDAQFDLAEASSTRFFIYKGRTQLLPIDHSDRLNAINREPIVLGSQDLNQALVTKPTEGEKKLPSMMIARGKRSFLGQIGIGDNAFRTPHAGEFEMAAKSLDLPDVPAGQLAEFEAWIQQMRATGNWYPAFERYEQMMRENLPENFMNGGDGGGWAPSWLSERRSNDEQTGLVIGDQVLNFESGDHFKEIRSRLSR